MKIVVISDIHGNDAWKQIVNKQKDADLFVFLGDYFDSHDGISTTTQIYNFKKIIEFKEENYDKVILLFGNHDFHYGSWAKQSYSGYDSVNWADIQDILHNALNKDLLQMCYNYQHYLFTHAGITRTWLNNVSKGKEFINGEELMNYINDLFKYTPNVFEFTPGNYYSPYGDEICQTPIWVRPNSLEKDRLNDFIQIVGHTQQTKLNPVPKFDVVYCDALNTSDEYLIIDGDKLDVDKVNRYEQ